MSDDLSRLDDSARRILAVACSNADQQLSRCITWRHILAGAMHQIPALAAKLREMGISGESLLDDQKHVGDRELGGPRPEGSEFIPLGVEVASAVADSDATALSFVCNVVKASAEAIIRLRLPDQRLLRSMLPVRPLRLSMQPVQRVRYQPCDFNTGDKVLQFFNMLSNVPGTRNTG